MVKDNCGSVYYDREAGKFCGLDSKVLKQLEETYEGINVSAELNKMSLWLGSEKGKRRKGTIGFVLNWLNNATPMPPTRSEHIDIIQSPTPLGQHVREYLMGLWEKSENILEFNTIKAKT